MRYLSSPYLDSAEASIARKYLTLCHDVCHAAVMFEDQHVEIDELFRNGLRIGKVQVSSAVEVDWSVIDADSIVQANEQLSKFAENRYLHQTLVQSEGNGTKFYEDLSLALASATREGRWRVHFHVPIFLESIGLLKSTRSEIRKTLQILQNNPAVTHAFTGHFEVETYAWGVLPEAMRDAGLVAGIAQELEWFRENLNGRNFNEASTTMPTPR